MDAKIESEFKTWFPKNIGKIGVRFMTEDVIMQIEELARDAFEAGWKGGVIKATATECGDPNILAPHRQQGEE